MSITLDGIWAHAQRLSLADRKVLTKMLADSLEESEADRKKRVSSEIDRFFGGWSDDPRSSEERMTEIQKARTENTLYLH